MHAGPFDRDDLVDIVGVIRRVLHGRLTCVAFSPHLDDAVLSCGGLLSCLARSSRVVVATLFTEASAPPWPLVARRVTRAAGHRDPREGMAARRQEDVLVVRRLGAHHEHHGLVDAPYRRHRRRIGPSAIYPTFRFDAFRGRPSRRDRPTEDAVRDVVRDVLARHQPGLVLAPLGVGRHVDHVIVRNAVLAATSGRPCTTLLYSDFPYALREGPDRDLIDRWDLVGEEWSEGRERALELMQGYESQLRILFPGGKPPSTPETYWTVRGSAPLD